MAGSARRPEPMCPIRPGDRCSLCMPGATGPQDCGLAYLVMSDAALREDLHALRAGTGPRRAGLNRRVVVGVRKDGPDASGD